MLQILKPFWLYLLIFKSLFKFVSKSYLTIPSAIEVQKSKLAVTEGVYASARFQINSHRVERL